MKNGIQNNLMRASKVYEEQVFLRTLILEIPFIGNYIDILFTAKANKYASKRIEFFLKDLQKQIYNIDEKKINYEFLNSEEGFDLIIKTFNYASRARQKEKLKLYARIIKETLSIKKKFENEEPELYLKIVEELSLKELTVAKYLYELLENRKSENLRESHYDDTDLISKHYSEFEKEDLSYILIRLERTGLIKEITGMYIGNPGGQYQITKLFKDFMNFISNLDTE
ncbi:MAG TPA: hypothetical protein VHP32_07400 [Ignavibacteria bacterium]|nr:hypothetical protein [Ignavibacteria bacterium]